MGDFFKKILETLKNVLGKLDNKQKIIVGAVAALLVGLLVFAVSSSSEPTLVYLFKKPLSQADYAKITKKLQEYGAGFRTKDDRYVLVKDEKTGAQLRMKLAQDNLLPKDIKGWELFDTEKWTTTDFERNVMKRRAIIGAMTRHLRMIEDIESVKLTVSMPEPSLYMQKDEPWKASVTITKKPFSDIYKNGKGNRKKIEGIIRIVANGIDRLKPEHIVVTDNKGNILSDFSDEDKTDYLARAKEEYKLSEQFRRRLENKLRQQLQRVLTKDRFDLTVKYELDFDQKKEERKEIIPIVLQKDDPETPYSEYKYTLKAQTSTKDTREEFKGPTYIPEGPAGTENNIPPGLKEKINRFSHYQKNERIENNEYSRKNTTVKKAPYEIKKIAVAAWIDGVWEKVLDKDGNPVVTKGFKIKRNYLPVKKETLRTVQSVIQKAIAYNPGRGDQVVVEHLQFDRRAEFEKEDEEIRRREQIRRTLIAAVAALFLLFIGTLLYRAVQKEIQRRKRIREEELALQQQRMREQALRAAEEEGVEVELSLEEKARMEMQENAINMARERPEEVAQLLRTWLMEE